MAEIINLRAKRKDSARKQAHARGDENAARFGRTKAQKALEAAQIAQARAELDGKKIDGD